MISFHLKYFLLAFSLFIVEVLIAAYVDDSIIRPYGGDFLVVILIYCFIKAFCNAPVKAVALSVLLFSYVIEILQYAGLVQLLGLQKSRLANIIIGNSFAWTDLLAYTLGIVFVIWMEKKAAPEVQKAVLFIEVLIKPWIKSSRILFSAVLLSKGKSGMRFITYTYYLKF